MATTAVGGDCAGAPVRAGAGGGGSTQAESNVMSEAVVKVVKKLSGFKFFILRFLHKRPTASVVPHGALSKR